MFYRREQFCKEKNIPNAPGEKKNKNGAPKRLILKAHSSNQIDRTSLQGQKCEARCSNLEGEKDLLAP